MKTMLYTVGVVGALAVSQAQAGAPTNLFVHAESDVEAVAGCLVESISGQSAASCLCAASENAFDFCEDEGLPFQIDDASGILAADIDVDYTKLYGKVKTVGSFNDLLIEVAGSCTLGGADGSLVIVDPVDTGDSALGNIVGEAKLEGQYAAVYMWPQVNKWHGQPVRLCARGDLSGLALAGSAGTKEAAAVQIDDVKPPEDPFVAALSVDAQDLGGTYAFQWALDDVKKASCGKKPRAGSVEEKGYNKKCKKPAFSQTNHVKVHFLVVAGVGAGILQNLPDSSYVGTAVWAEAKLKDRAMHVQAQSLEVIDADPVLLPLDGN
jgi:hypothetical protein